MSMSPGRVRQALSLRRAVAAIHERLEQRTLFSVTLDPNGATVITPNVGDNVIYCSSSAGNDKNNGLSPLSPVQSIAKAETLLRNHTGDELLFKAGDVWNGGFGYWSLSGASASDPMLVGSYGTGARPEFLTGTASGITTGRSSAPEVDFLAIMGLNFFASGRDPNMTPTPSTSSNPTGVLIISRSNDVLVENCETQYYTDGMNVEKTLGELQNISIRRNIVVNSWATTMHSEGLYALGVDGLTLDGNFFDHNGYNDQIAGATPNWYNHDVYLNSTNTGCVVEDNIFSRAAGYGLQDRPGGIVRNNIFINDPIGMTFGIVNGASSTAGGVSGSITGNVFIGGANIGTIQGGQAISMGNLKPGVVVSNNIFTTSIVKAQPAIALVYGTGQSNPQDSVGINSLTLSGNILYNWTNGIDVEYGMTPGGIGLTALNHVTFTNNQFENLTGTVVNNHTASYAAQETWTGNTYYNAGQTNQGGKTVAPIGQVLSSPMPFADPGRSIASYDAATGGAGSVNTFLAAVAGQNEQSWKANYDAASIIRYIDAGFSLSGPVVPPAIVPPVVPTAPTGRSAAGTFQALQYSTQSGGMKFDNFKGLGYINGGGWVEYDSIDFGTGVSTFTANLAALTSGGTLQLRLDSVTGPIVGTLNVTASGAWNTYNPESTTVAGATGVHKLYLVFAGGKGVCNISTFAFA